VKEKGVSEREREREREGIMLQGKKKEKKRRSKRENKMGSPPTWSDHRFERITCENRFSIALI
jgi:hypothetical protein